MCQIVVIKNSEKLSREFLSEQHILNSDGVGFCYFKNGKWYWKKFLDFESFYNFYTNCNYQRAIIHFRLGTFGSKSLSNVHPFLISTEREIDLNEGILNDNEILLMQNGITNTIFDIAKFYLCEDLRKKDFSDTKTIAYLFKKLNIFDVKEIAKRLYLIDSTSRFAIITNKKVVLLGNFTKHSKNVYLSSPRRICTYNNNKKRLDCSSEVEKLICEKLKTDYSRTNLRYDFDLNLFELEIENEKKIFGVKGLKRFLKKIGVEQDKIEEIIRKIKEDVEKEKNKNRDNKNRDYYNYYYNYDYYDYFR
jgi:predicted glutamine amidotransferase